MPTYVKFAMIRQILSGNIQLVWEFWSKLVASGAERWHILLTL